MDFKEAEAAALAWMHDVGFADAVLTKPGADSGIDVKSTTAVAQVKAEQSPTGRPAVQKIHGVASNLGLQALFFATAGYTRQASDWADEAGVALFELTPNGAARPVNDRAARLTDNRKVGSVSDGDTVNLTRGLLLADGTTVDLRFTVSDCESCGQSSPKSAGCQYCGETQPAEDPAVSARRRSVEAARARVRPTASRTGATAGDIFLEYAETDFLSRHLELISVIDAAGSEWESRYADNLRRFDGLRQKGDLSTNRSDRTWGPVWPHVDRILKITDETIDAYERGATASTPDLAATYFGDGQRGLDRLTRAIAEYRTDLDERTRRNLAADRMSTHDAAGSGCFSLLLLSALVVASILSALYTW